MKMKDSFRVARNICIVGIAIIGLAAIIGSGTDDIKDAACFDGTVSGTYEFTEPNTIKITVDDTNLPDVIDLVAIGFVLDQEYTYTYDEAEIETAMAWLDGGAASGWNWVRDGESTGDFTGNWAVDDKNGIDYRLEIADDPHVFTITATKCLLE